MERDEECKLSGNFLTLIVKPDNINIVSYEYLSEIHHIQRFGIQVLKNR